MSFQPTMSLAAHFFSPPRKEAGEVPVVEMRVPVSTHDAKTPIDAELKASVCLSPATV